jgi:hypothetical protein
MSSPYNLPDYVTKFFEYKKLTQIHGKPSVESLLQLFREVKRNSQTVRTTLGGGQHGYLALILDPVTYTGIPTTTLFNRPLDPGPFIITMPPIPPATRAHPAPVLLPLTSADIAIQKASYDSHLRHYNECQAVELALRNQITDALETDYLSALRDPVTDMIPSNIPAIFSFLQANYGKISPNQLMEKEDTLKDVIYDVSEPIDSVFNKVDRFSDLCELIQDPISDRRKTMLAYKIISKNNAFMDSLKMWNRKALRDKTYTNMKIFMRAEYSDLDEVGGLTLNNSILNQANILQELKSHQEEIAARMENNLKINMIEAMTGLCDQYGNEENCPPTQHHQYPPSEPSDVVNNLSSSDKAIFQLLKTLQDKVEALSSANHHSSGNNSSTNTTSTPRYSPSTSANKSGPLINPNTGKAYRRYCWTHGCCGHWGRHCDNPKPGHKNEANFKDRMGGSNKLCLPVPQK